MSNQDQLARDILSDVTIFMKYSKYRDDLGRRETWDELVDRNVAMHVKKYPMLEKEIYQVYDDYVRTKKVLPSMRSLQFAGPAIDKNPARIYNCLRRNTKFVTSEGVKSFEDFEDGEEIVVLTHLGLWQKATVRSYGKDMLYRIDIKRGNSSITEYATKNHRWILSDRTETTNLSVKDYVLGAPSIFEKFNYDEAEIKEKLYWAYGYVFGDGTVTSTKSGKYSMVRLCGKDKERYSYRFEELGFESSSSLSCGGDPIFYTGTYLKTSPDPKIDSPELIRAFVAGYLSADGKKNHDDSSLSQYCGILASDEYHQKVVEELFPVAGIFVSSKRDYTGKVTNYGVRKAGTKDYSTFEKISNKTNALFRVSSITEFQEEEVWCLEVENDHSFVLASGISTGNCSFLPVEHLDAFGETMFLLLGGTGVGVSVQQHHVAKLPPLLGPSKLEGKERPRRYLVGDSIEGWADAIKVLIESFFKGKKPVLFDFSDVRPKGHRLVTAGGKAPGAGPLRESLVQIINILERAISERGRGTFLRPIEAHDMICHIADSVLAGGIRRSALISLFSFDDADMLSCKFGNWWESNPQRGRANNSVVLDRSRIQEEEFFQLWNKVKASGSGEPGFYFTNDPDWGTNPCVEIALRPYQMCNLCEVNASDVTSQEDLENRVRAGAFIGTLQAGYTEFHYLRDVWRKTIEKEALLGVSMTGIGSGAVMHLDLKRAGDVVKKENIRVAEIIGINPAARATAVKPAGTTSLVLGSSSGIHAWHNDYYVRRVRVGKNEAIYSYLKDNHPQLIEDDYFRPQDTSIICVPQKAPEGSMVRTESPLTTLERVKKFSVEWVASGHSKGRNRHNVSCTISIKEDEWGEVGKWMWLNRDYYSGISVLPYDNGTYVQAPFTDCTKEEYEGLLPHLSAIDLTKVIETEDSTDLQGEIACAGGACNF